MKRDSFILYSKITETVELLDNEQKGILFQAILDYANEKEPQIDDTAVKIAFTPIKQDLDANNEKWEESKKLRSEAGKKGASSRWNDGNATNANGKNGNAINANGKNGNAINAINANDNVNGKNGNAINEMAKMAVNVYVNDNVDVNDNVPPIGGNNTRVRAKTPERIDGLAFVEPDAVADNIDDPDVAEALNEWLDCRREDPSPMPPVAVYDEISRAKSNIEKYGTERCVDVIKQSLTFKRIAWDKLKYQNRGSPGSDSKLNEWRAAL